MSALSAETTAPPHGSEEPASELPPVPQPLSPRQVRYGLNISIYEGALATIFISITGAIGGSVFLTGFALLLGANSFQLGLLGALPFIGQLFGFLSAYLEEQLGQRRILVMAPALVGRLVWALLLALPFMSFLRGAEIGIFLSGLAISYALNGMAGNAWISWMSDLVPPRERGRYFGVRNMIASIVAMASTYLAGSLLDIFRAGDQEATGYAAIFAFAVVTGVFAAFLLRLQPEPPMQRDGKPQADLRSLFGGPLRDGRFRNYTLAAMGWMLVTGIAAPFFNAHGLGTLKLSFAILSLQAIVTSAVALICQPLIGQLQDRWGDRRVLLGSMLGVVPLPWGWVLSTPDNIIPLWLTSIFSGVFWPGINQGMMNVLMDRAPVSGRSAAIASYGAITGLGTFLAGLIGGALSSALAGMPLSLGPLTLTNFTLLFVATSIGRLLMVYAFWRTL